MGAGSPGVVPCDQGAGVLCCEGSCGGVLKGSLSKDVGVIRCSPGGASTALLGEAAGACWACLEQIRGRGAKGGLRRGGQGERARAQDQRSWAAGGEQWATEPAIAQMEDSAVYHQELHIIACRQGRA